MNQDNDEQDDMIKLKLTSKDGTNVRFKVKKDEVVDILIGLGFGPEEPNSMQPKKSKKIRKELQLQNSSTEKILSENSKIEQIKILIRSISKNPGHWFTSKDILALYEQHIGEIISLSTVSTYLSRLEHQQILEKRGSKKDLEYCLKSSELELIPLYDLVEKKFISMNKKK